MLTSDQVRERLVQAADATAAEPPSTDEVLTVQRRARRWTTIVLAVVGLALVVAISYAGFFAAAAVRPFDIPLVDDSTVVPDVVGMTLAAAEDELDRSKLLADVRSRCDAGDRRCVVRRQLTPPGERVERGSKIGLRAALPPRDLVRVPDVEGQPLDAARATLEGAGLRAAPQGECSDGCVVTDQQPAGGDRRPAGTEVALTVAAQAQLGTVPDVITLSREAAAAALEAAAFTAEAEDQCAGEPSCAVIEQAPGAGEEHPEGATVRIVLGGGEPVTVPDLLGLDEAAAVERLRASELREHVRGGCEAEVACQVAGQSVAPQQEVSPRTVVTLRLAPAGQRELPRLAGTDARAAAARLTALGLEAVFAAPCAEWAHCDVERQKPPAGTLVSLGDTVTLHLAAVEAAVPNVVGLSVAAATDALDARRLVAAPSATAGLVISQGTTAGTFAAVGSEVPLIVEEEEQPPEDDDPTPTPTPTPTESPVP